MRRIRLGIPVIVVALTGVVEAQSQRERDAAFNEIRTLEQQERYTQAASRLATYLTRFVKSETPLYVTLQFRLAFDRELSGDSAAAAEAYCACLAHPRIDDRDSVFAGMTVKQQAEARLAALRHTCGHASVITTIITRSGKGGIRVARAKLPAPYSSEETLTIAGRMRGLDSIEEAGRISRALFASQRTVPMGYASGGGLVVAVRRGSDRTARGRVETLGGIAAQIRQAYFPGLVSKRVLYVYASEDEEPGGAALSSAVHFRDMEGLEAYYQPLDNSVVLRRGDAFGGTAAHELTHALMNEDFSRAPRWLDEGLASLQEEQDAVGPVDNYRLYYLLEALGEGAFPQLRDVLESDSGGWFDDRAPIYAAYSRYLAMYFLRKDPAAPMLTTLYGRVKTAQGDRRSPEVALAALQDVAHLTPDEMESDFARFVKSRNVTPVDRKWQPLRDDIRDWVRTAAHP